MHFLKKPLTLILILLPLLACGYVVIDFLGFALSPYRPYSTEETIILIHKGHSPNEITQELFKAQVIGNPKKLVWLGKIMRGWRKLKVGEYKLSAAMTPVDIFKVLSSGIGISYSFTVQEGDNIYEIAEKLESKKLSLKKIFIPLCKNNKFIETLGFKTKELPSLVSLEGYLYPDTYLLNKTMSPEEIIKMMTKKFYEVWAQDFSKRAKELRLTQHEVITLASIIEKETGAPEERALISSVFHNRLNKKMRLQSDPTSIYGIWEKYRGNLTKRDLSLQNPYNTYVISSLPPGPIGNPGKATILAALYPANTQYYYFVSKNEGLHEFTKTYAEHIEAVRKYQLDPKAREGKSWRNRLKKK
ncbi:MAG: endolytic transglycosylase MltG [Deltaproteobacteria bacterium]|nr:endolytic transglycosylase MltG [Deltaproteobacteria bacterium]